MHFYRQYFNYLHIFQIFGWARKAQNCKLQMVPIPADPLALPFTLKSDPLRGPIYVPLNIDPLLRSKTALFEGISFII